MKFGLSKTAQFICGLFAVLTELALTGCVDGFEHTREANKIIEDLNLSSHIMTQVPAQSTPTGSTDNSSNTASTTGSTGPLPPVPPAPKNTPGGLPPGYVDGITNSFTCSDQSKTSVSKLNPLGKDQLVNTLVDLFTAYIIGQGASGIESHPIYRHILDYPDDTNVLSNQNSDSFLGELQLDKIHQIMYAVTERTTQDAVSAGNYISRCFEKELSLTVGTELCFNQFLDGTAKRIFRRPLLSEERQIYLNLYLETSKVSGPLFALKTVLNTLLESPQFLYHLTNQGQLISGTTYSLTPYELASRLSYSVWGSMPDAALMSAADDGSLMTETGFNSQVERLFASSRARAWISRFFNHWIDLDRFPNPNYSTAFIGNDMYQGTWTRLAKKETISFIDHILWTKSGTYYDLMNSNEAVVSSLAGLEKVYGIPSVAGSTDTLVQLPNHRGLINRIGFLAGGNDQTNPILRGAKIRVNFLCQRMVRPDPNDFPAGSFSDPVFSADMTTRERFELKTSNTACMYCHNKINPVGFPLESYDSLGRYRITENIFSNNVLVKSLPINSTTSPLLTPADGGLVTNGAELATHLGKSEVGPACMTRQFFQYTNQRYVDLDSDACSLANSNQALIKAGGSIVEMMKSTIKAPAFKRRNGGI